MWRALLALFGLLTVARAVTIHGPSEVKVHDSVTLLCEGEGVLVWSYEGVPLMGGGRVLVIADVSQSDVGQYTCSNGTISDNITLTLLPSEDSGLIRNAVVGSVIGVGVIVVMLVLVVYGLVLCSHNRDKVSDRDAMSYDVKEEFVATLNMDALDKLDPEVRSHMDLNFLAQLTNTDPSLLDKYKAPLEAIEETEDPSRDSPSRVSLTSIHQVYVEGLGIARQLRLTEPPTPPRPLSHRQSAIEMTPSSAPRLHRQASCKSFGSSEMDESIGHRQNFLRMLNMVPRQQDIDEHTDNC